MDLTQSNLVPPARPIARSRSGKAAEKRREIALHALSALSELGFARINLREIALRSGIGLGVIHYYFKDKTELLIECVAIYKDAFVLRLRQCILESHDAQSLRASFIDILVSSIAEHAQTHRLWYDVRAQALFDPAFEPIVAEFEEKLAGVVAEFLNSLRDYGKGPSALNVNDPLAVYLTMDGWFRYCLQQHLAANEAHSKTLDEFRLRLEGLLAF